MKKKFILILLAMGCLAAPALGEHRTHISFNFGITPELHTYSSYERVVYRYPAYMYEPEHVTVIYNHPAYIGHPIVYDYVVPPPVLHERRPPPPYPGSYYRYRSDRRW